MHSYGYVSCSQHHPRGTRDTTSQPGRGILHPASQLVRVPSQSPRRSWWLTQAGASSSSSSLSLSLRRPTHDAAVTGLLVGVEVDTVPNGVERVDERALKHVQWHADAGDLLCQVTRPDVVCADGRHGAAVALEVRLVQRVVARPRLQVPPQQQTEGKTQDTSMGGGSGADTHTFSHVKMG